LLCSAKSAHSKYKQHLEEKKKAEEKRRLDKIDLQRRREAEAQKKN
jgi:hypothetical protein